MCQAAAEQLLRPLEGASSDSIATLLLALKKIKATKENVAEFRFAIDL